MALLQAAQRRMHGLERRLVGRTAQQRRPLQQPLGAWAPGLNVQLTPALDAQALGRGPARCACGTPGLGRAQSQARVERPNLSLAQRVAQVDGPIEADLTSGGQQGRHAARC